MPSFWVDLGDAHLHDLKIELIKLRIFGRSNMNMTTGDLVDRWTITRMKYRASKPNPELLKVLDALEEEVQQAMEVASTRMKWLSFSHALYTLIEINAQMWELEAMLADLRGQKEIDQTLVGKVALTITAKNKLRVLAINTINDIFV